MTITEDHDTTAPTLVEISIDDLHPADDNPRAELGDLDGLAQSIAAVGILEPLIVVERVIAGGYTIVAGHRRHAAARLAGLTTVPCVVRDFTTEQRIEAMVVENLQREGLSPFDEARAMQWLVDLGHTQRQIAERIGCNQSHVSRRLQLTKLPDAAVKLVTDGKLHLRQAEELAALPDDDIDDVCAQVAERAKGFLERGDTELPSWLIPDVVAKLTRTRKHAAAVAAGEASGLPRLTDHRDAPGGYSSKYEKCKKAEATHWFVEGSSYGLGQSVIWGRKKPKASTSPTSSSTSDAGGMDTADHTDWEAERERRAAEEAANKELLVRLLDAQPDLVRATGLEVVVGELCGNYHEATIWKSGLEQLVGAERFAALTDDHGLTIAACVLAGYTEPDAYDEELRQVWAKLRAAADWDLVPVEPDPDANEQFALVDGSTSVEIIAGSALSPDDHDHDGHTVDVGAVDLVEQLANSLDAAKAAGDVPKSWTTSPPWAAWKTQRTEQIVNRIGQLLTTAKVRRCCVYEQATTGRVEIVNACFERLHELGES